jgi:hypothetical protein
MAFPLTENSGLPHARGHTAKLRFTRRRDLRRRHNPHVDAAWWPRSPDLTAELGHLLQVAEESGFRPTAVSYALDDGWTAAPERVAHGGRKIKVSGYHNHHQDMITLIDGVTHERLQVLVVPFSTPPLLARRALRVAAVHADPIQGSDLLALARGETNTADETG